MRQDCAVSASTTARHRRLLFRLCAVAFVLAVLMVSLVSYALADTPTFPDVSSSHPYYTAINDLASRGIIGGFEDGTFRASEPVTRQQFAKMIVKTKGYTVTGDEVCPFIDVDVQSGTDPFYPSRYVAVCALHAITTGVTPNTFAPTDKITHQQLITMVVRAAALANPPAEYVPAFSPGQFALEQHYQNARKAAFSGLLQGLQGVGDSYNFAAPSTRGECAQLLYNLRQSTTVSFDGEIKIGVLNSLTGANSPNGDERRWAQEKACADANAAGGVTLADGKRYKFVLAFADDKSDPTEAQAAMEKLITVEGCEIILSSNLTPVSQPAALVADQRQVYFHVDTAWTDIMLATGYDWFNDMFCSPGDVIATPFQALEEVPEAARPTKCAVLVENTSDGLALGGGVVAIGQAFGYDMALSEPFTRGTEDFTSTILTLKSAGIDGLWCFMSPADGITFTKQCRQQNFAPEFIFGWNCFSSNDFRDTLEDDCNYVGHDGFWYETLPYPGAQALGNAYRADHDGADSTMIGLPYASFQVLVQAIQDCGSIDPATVRDGIRGSTYEDTVMGDVTYAPNGICTIDFLTLEWIDGERRIAWPVQADGFTWEMMPPWSGR